MCVSVLAASCQRSKCDCFWRSNMELPMQHGLTRNRTYELLAKGHYSNIRTYKRAQHLKLRDGESLPFVLPPPAPPSCPERNGRFSSDVPTCYHGWQLSNASTVDEFSAACWFTAQELTDIEEDCKTILDGDNHEFRHIDGAKGAPSEKLISSQLQCYAACLAKGPIVDSMEQVVQ